MTPAVIKGTEEVPGTPNDSENPQESRMSASLSPETKQTSPEPKKSELNNDETNTLKDNKETPDDISSHEPEKKNVNHPSNSISFTPVTKPTSTTNSTEISDNADKEIDSTDPIKSKSHIDNEQEESKPKSSENPKPATSFEVSTSPSASAPNQSSSGNNVQTGPTICQNCQTSTTPLWRRDESGQILCNACGLFLKLHGRPRPISLKTNIIKSRNRARNGSSQSKRKQNQSPIPITNVSPSFSAISPHLLPHGSPLRQGMIGHDLNQIDHLSMSLSPSMNPQVGDSHVSNTTSLSQSHGHSQSNLGHHHNQHQNPPNLQHQRLHPHPTTPSSIFSYPSATGQSLRDHSSMSSKLPQPPVARRTAGSPNFGYHKPHSGIHSTHTGGPESPLLTPMSQREGELQQNGTRSYPNGSGNGNRPLIPIVSAVGTPGFSATTPQFNASSPRQSEDHSLPKLPALSSLTALANASECEDHRKPPGTSAGQNSLPPISQSLSGELTSVDGTGPQILTPLSRPQSPSLAATNGYISKIMAQEGSVRLSAKGEAMSEQLRPRLSDESLEKIPPLRQLVNERFSGSFQLGANHSLPSQILSSLSQPRSRLNNGSQSSFLNHGNQDDPSSEATKLKTRVSELELVNDLLRSRVTQLEYSEANIRESELILRRKLHEIEEKNRKLLRKIKQIFTEERETRKHTQSDFSDDLSSDYLEPMPKSKKMKVSDIL